ncbi:MAG: MFS transporter [Hyphomicrobiales bacterium]|nr:MFS transporter [Hyphomicrobiales bacterium]
MLAILRNRTYRHLFAAQVIALTGTGLMTVALALLAYELAGENAGAVLGTALAIKMVAYVAVAPVVGGLAVRLNRRMFLVVLDIVRASVALALPFVDSVWQIYLLVALLQAASAGFTPTFQATIPDILTDEGDYTRALSLSRLAYDLENLLSPLLAAALIGLVGFHWLFGGTVIGFLVSAALVLSVNLPKPAADGSAEPVSDRMSRGIRIYLATPRLRGLLALNLSVAAAGAMVLVNTVVLVKGRLGLTDTDMAVALAAFGAGSMLAALALPRLLERANDRMVMIPAAAIMAVLLFGFAVVVETATPPELWVALLVVWALLGFGYATTQVPVGRLLRRSAHANDRPAVYAAQFASSHLCWLVTYPLAGWLGEAAGMTVTLICLGALAGAGAFIAARQWPVHDPEILVHDHQDLPPEHPHLAGATMRHAHPYRVDDLHAHWPTPSR